MNVKLIVVGGKNAGRIIPIAGAKFLIGRAEDCHLRPSSDLVSRHHCAILMGPQGASVRDFDSRNGTLLNGQRVQGEQKLNSKDKLQVGPLMFEILVQADLVAPKKPKVQSIEEAAARTANSAAEKPADDGELDITDWVTETVDGDTDTKAMNTAQTGTVATYTPSTDTPSDDKKTADAKNKIEEEKKKKKKKAPPQKASGIHGPKKPTTADSQAAATETLRAFFNRK